MENSRLQLNPGRTEWLWGFGSANFGTSPSLNLDVHLRGPSRLMNPDQRVGDHHD